MEIEVERGDFEGALRAFQKMIGRSGLIKELRLRRFYEKPSTKRKRKMRQNQKRLRRMEMKRIDRGDGQRVARNETGPSWRFERMDGECRKIQVDRKEMSQRY